MLMSNACNVSAVPEDELYLLNRFYKRNGHKGKATASDRAFWLRQEGRILAAVRFTPVEEGALLRGLWVDRSVRGEGLGRALLEGCRNYWSRRRCYCFPYRHLQQWYAGRGFVLPDVTTPAALLGRLHTYRERGEDLVLMQYVPAEAP